MKPIGPLKAASLTILYVPPRAHENREDLISRARSLNFNQPWTTHTEIIQRRVRPSEIPFNARICVPDLTRFGGTGDALTFFLIALERNCEIWAPGFRLSALDPDFNAKKSVFEMFAKLKKEIRSIGIVEGLHLSKIRGHVQRRKTISEEQEAEIRRSYQELKSYSKVAKKHGVSRTTVHRAVKRGQGD